MIKWIKKLMIPLLITLLLVGCNENISTKEEVYKDFQKKITSMNGYECEVEVKATGNKSTSTYTAIHKYKKEDQYIVEMTSPKHLKGKIIEYKGDNLKITNPELNDIVQIQNKGRKDQYLFVGEFIKNYLQTEEIEINFNNESLILKTEIPGESEYFKYQVMYINKKTKCPERMDVIDEQGNTRFTIKYENFIYNK